jgi:hypothetical protein
MYLCLTSSKSRFNMVLLKHNAELYTNHISERTGQNVSNLRLLSLTLNDDHSRRYRIQSWTFISNKEMGLYIFYLCLQ